MPIIDRVRHHTCFGDGSHNSLYFLGMIDGLTNYSAKKRAAHAAKTAKHGVGAGCARGGRWWVGERVGGRADVRVGGRADVRALSVVARCVL